MKRIISLHILLVFLLAFTHSAVDHAVGGHKSYVLLPHDESVPAQPSDQHPPEHSTHHQDEAALHLEPVHVHGSADIHTHFTLAPWPRSGSAYETRLLALTSLIWAANTISDQIPFFPDDSLLRPSRFRPLYLRCCSLLI